MNAIRVGPLVRAITSGSGVIWVELWQAGEVTVRVVPMEGGEERSVRVHTVTVGGRYYAALQLVDLQPGTWYGYEVECSADELCFRTLDAVGNGEEQPLLIAYGSCRDLRGTGNDALSAFGRWLEERFETRERDWPRLLLLIGDQIYADEPSVGFLQSHPQLQKGAQVFGDFADMYEYAWTGDEGVRQVLARVPTYAIFDDHEITNNWDITPLWRERLIKHGKEQLLVDGLVAYWVYQGWGNMHERDGTAHPLLEIMQHGAKSGEDVLEDLRATILPEVRGNKHLRWHYEIPTMPPVLVMDVRADRPATFASPLPFTEKPSRIMSQEQMEGIASWLYENRERPVVLVSSVPVLLPPLIGWAEYMMGIRPWYRQVAPLRWLGRQVARIQYRLAMRTSFDHWPVFTETWRELVEGLTEREQDVVVLSGDVHFSYAMEGRGTKRGSKGARLLQLVSTPFENELDESSRKLVLGQARLKGARYGGLRMRMLPMYRGERERVPFDMLLQNVVAMVRIGRKEDGGYEVEQEYLGVSDGGMEVVGRTVVEET